MSDLNAQSSSKRCPTCGAPISSDGASCSICDAKKTPISSEFSLLMGVSDRQIAVWIGVLAMILSGYSVFVAWSRSINDDDPVGPGITLVALLLENGLLWGLPLLLFSGPPVTSADQAELRAKIFWQTQVFVCLSAVPMYLLLGTICSQIVPKGPFF